MQQDTKSARVSFRIDNLEAAPEKGSTTRRPRSTCSWPRRPRGGLHPRALDEAPRGPARHDRFSELAFAYERLVGERRLGMLPQAAQAEVLVRAAEFLADSFGDPGGARPYLERALSVLPSHQEAFFRARAHPPGGERAAEARDLYALGAGHRADRAEQLSLLHRAFDLIDVSGNGASDEERAIKLLQQIFKVDPGDSSARWELEARYARAGRHQEIARMLEQALTAKAPPPDALEIRARLIDLYSGPLKEIERAPPHVEEVLAQNLTTRPPSAPVRFCSRARPSSCARPRRSRRPTRAAGRPGGGADDGPPDREPARGRAASRCRSGSSSCSSRGSAISRRRSRRRSRSSRWTRPTRRCASASWRSRRRSTARPTRRALLRARVVRRPGEAAQGAHRRRARRAVREGLGDGRKARASFQQVLDGEPDDAAVRRAARGLGEALRARARRARLAGVLERLAEAEPEAEAREAAAERLARLGRGGARRRRGARSRPTAGSRSRASREPGALAALERLCEATSAHEGLAWVLEQRRG